MADEEKNILQQTADSITSLGAAILKEGVPSIEGMVKAFEEMTYRATLLNNVFGQNRTRITELQQAVADTAPKIAALGGDMEATFDTMKGVSEALRRNVVGTADDYSRLFAASKVLGTDVKSIVEDFTDVGVQFSLVGGQVKSAVDYVQNLGLNTKQIMGDVSNNMKRINEFNFADGVQGLTKMAAQASLFRFDMNDSFTIMNKSLSPDGAIELASAFQRMGVAVGDLTDPFQLMNKSLNDPEGLQKSLIQMTKNYAEFDNKTKTFKMNPAGILQLREIAAQTGMNYDNLAKSALATANLDRAFKQLNPTIHFDKEEDRELLGSIATMNEKGEYMVNVKNEFGEDVKTRLSDLNQGQAKAIIEAEKQKPKTLEDYAKNQMDLTQNLLAEATAIRTNIEFGVSSTDQLRNMSEKFRDFATTSATEIKNAFPDSAQTRKFTSSAVEETNKILSEMMKGNMGSDKMVDSYNKLKEQFKEMLNSGDAKVAKLGETLESNFKKIVEAPKLSYKGKLGTTAGTVTTTPTTSSKLELGGGLTFKVEANPNVNKQQFEQFINSPEFRDKFLDIFRNLDPNARATIKKSLGF
jgi:hypothetical protein